MIERLEPAEIARIWRQDVVRPVDVLNLIKVSERFESYRWYGLLVAPLVYGLGGGIRWMGKHARSFAGKPQADKLIVVRYRSHRHFLAMTLNPYYVAINRLRERGVRSFEASWTNPTVDDTDLGRHRWLLVAHYTSPAGDDALDRVRETLEPFAGELVYASRESATMSFLSNPQPTDPRPLTHPEVAFFSPRDSESIDGRIGPGVIASLEAATDGVSLQLYRREAPQANLPRLPLI